jgi:hypothetical protein
VSELSRCQVERVRTDGHTEHFLALVDGQQAHGQQGRKVELDAAAKKEDAN